MPRSARNHTQDAGDGVSEEKPTRKGIYIIPNLLTTANLFAGFFAIVQATKGNFEAAAVAIFIALVMDGLDGRIARVTHAESDFGTEYDSLVDMVSFGLTPALVVYLWALQDLGKVGWLGAFVYAAAVGLRLARFNTHHSHDKRYFQGLPCPAAAALVAGLVWAVTDFGMSGHIFDQAVWVLTVALGLAMVSNLRYRSFKDFDVRRRVRFVATILVVLAIVLIVYDPARVLFALFAVYFLSGPVTTFVRWRRGDSLEGS